MPNWLRRLWHGRYHASLVRQISGEEHVSITFAESSREAFDRRLGAMLGILRTHMIEHNNGIVLRLKAQIDGIVEEINGKAKEIDDLQKQIDAKKKKLTSIK